MGKKIVKVLIGLPKAGDTDPEAYDNRLEMVFHLGALQTLSHLGEKSYEGVEYDIPDNTEYQFSLSTIGDVFIAYAREQLATIATDNGFDYLFMIDDDMLVPKDLFERLIRHKVDIVAPLAFTRSFPHKPVIYNVEVGYDAEEKKDYYRNYSVARYPKDKLVQCDAVGFGAVLIDTKCFKGMAKPWMMSTSGAGEDIHFCHGAGEAGFNVYMDTSTKLAHLGNRKKITEETYEGESNITEERREKGDIDKYGTDFGGIRG